MTLLINSRVLHYTYDMGLFLFKKYICTLLGASTVKYWTTLDPCSSLTLGGVMVLKK